MNKRTKELYAKLAEKRLDAKLAALRADSSGVTFSVGQLEELEATIYETLFQPLQTLSVVPVSTEYAPGLNTITYRMSTKVGEAATITRSDQVRPAVDEFLEEFPQKVIEGGASYSYDIQHVETSALIDYDQVSAKARAAADAVARWHDRRALLGEAGIFEGLANNSTVPVTTLTDPDWSTASADAIYTQTAAFINTIEDNMDGQANSNALLMPIAYMNKLMTTRIDTVSGDSILDVLRRNFPAVTFSKLPALTGLGTASNDLLITGEITPRVVEYRATVVYDEAAPDKKGYSWDVQCRGRSGGTVIRYPLAMGYATVSGL